MQKHETLAISVVLFALAAWLIGQATAGGTLVPTTMTQAAEMFLGGLLYIVTFYLVTAGLITEKTSWSGLGTAPAISGVLLLLAQTLLGYAEANPSTVGGNFAYAIAGVLFLGTFWLVAQGYITVFEK